MRQIYVPYMPNFRIERWFGGHPQTVAGAESVSTAIAAFEAEREAHPYRKITLRHGSRVIREGGNDPLEPQHPHKSPS